MDGVGILFFLSRTFSNQNFRQQFSWEEEKE